MPKICLVNSEMLILSASMEAGRPWKRYRDFKVARGWANAKTRSKNWPSIQIWSFHEKFLTVTHIFLQFYGGDGFVCSPKTHGFWRKIDYLVENGPKLRFDRSAIYLPIMIWPGNYGQTFSLVCFREQFG